MARSTARKRALNTLYEADEKGQDILSLLSERIAEPGAQTPLPDYAIQIVRGVAEEQEGIDKALEARSVKWPLKRMAVVDRNILRIAAWEMLFNDEVPDRVTIDEALSLAKTLSDDDSPAFIHGLLSAVCEDKESVLVDINAAHEANAAQKAEHEAEERRLNSPTAPGFLQSNGVSGNGDGVPFDRQDADGGDDSVQSEQVGTSTSAPGANASGALEQETLINRYMTTTGERRSSVDDDAPSIAQPINGSQFGKNDDSFPDDAPGLSNTSAQRNQSHTDGDDSLII
ncbi:N utilization substance protein B [Bifidobacterium commune]|uniref:Transcription antitermination protein NusB n=1 Tax=Bifidobacterium commune TaxID=1505727 RepID=A0A1C4H0S7_9BIFI|nr:N utilization substance protein B [Bifidobacterium commune]SCC78489.1 NusB antitermination factor [Bifidobacterium commune]